MNFSIIICTYNSVEKLPKTLDSLLVQDFADYEVIIVDGASTDGTVEVIKNYEKKFSGRLRWISEKDKGIYEAMNKGVKMADGEFLNVVGAGDWLEKDALEKAVDCLSNNPDADAVHGKLRVWDKKLENNYLFQTFSKDLSTDPMQHPALYYKKNLHNIYGLYDESYKIAADYLFCIKTFLVGKAKAVAFNAVVDNYVTDGVSATDVENCSKETIKARKDAGLFFPLVSIVMPTFNHAKYIAESLNSVKKQFYPDWECIVIDDSSTDNTESIVKEIIRDDPRFKYFKQKNSGPSVARNRGISESRGEYILPLDSDDLISADYIAKAINVFGKNKNTKLVYCKASFIGDRKGEWVLPEYSYEKILFENMIFDSALFRRSDYDKTEGFNSNMTEGLEDWDFWLSFLKPKDIVYRIPEICFYYRIKKNSRNSFGRESSLRMYNQIFFNHRNIYEKIVNPLLNQFTIQQKDQEIQQKDQEIQQKDQEIQQKDQEIQQKDQEIQQKDQEIQFNKDWTKRFRKTPAYPLWLISKRAVKLYQEVIRASRKGIRIFNDEGLFSLFKGFLNYLSIIFKIKSNNFTSDTIKAKDFLFISGCYLDAPTRYRCVFPKEQLEKNGLSGDLVFYEKINEDLVKYYDVFIIFRAPLTDTLERLIKLAKKQNKMVIFDIDDLLFDEEILKEKHEVKEMTSAEKELYFDGMRRQLETMKMIDLGSTSTLTIKKEMQKYIPQVHISRNSVSDELIVYSEKAFKELVNKKRNKDKIILGYFSGSRTHDDDFKLIEDVLLEIFKKYKKVMVMIVGPLKLSNKFNPYKARFMRKKFVKWQELPRLIMQIDINLAPLVINQFNNGKSELKFTESALLRKPTVASATKPFLFAIKENETGFIARNNNDWLDNLSKLIENEDLRKKIGENAYKDVLKRYNTEEIGRNFLNFINKNKKKKIVYVSPSTQISGGVMVICQHLQRLQERGYNASLVTMDDKEKIDWFENFSVPIIPYSQFSFNKKKNLIDICVATLWSTVFNVKNIFALKKIYLVQNKEHFFYKEKDPKFIQAKTTYYEKNFKFLTISKWCEDWLKKDFNQCAGYVPNGIDVNTFYKTKSITNKKHGKTRILIEGNPNDDYKNVDESFEIIKKLDPEKFEIWFISYGGKPKNWYKYDKFFQKIPYKEMKKYYSSCDILLKTSRLESFSYPPLEMMACEGVCVVAENEGNKEYVKNEFNALTYKLGDIEDAVEKINRIIKDEDLRKKLIKNGLSTVKERCWDKAIDLLENFLLYE